MPLRRFALDEVGGLQCLMRGRHRGPDSIDHGRLRLVRFHGGNESLQRAFALPNAAPDAKSDLGAIHALIWNSSFPSLSFTFFSFSFTVLRGNIITHYCFCNSVVAYFSLFSYIELDICPILFGDCDCASVK